jgi:UPF0716 protein FxsA
VPILVLLFIVVPIAELYVIIKVGSLIGVLPTLAILLADALLGSMLLRQQGRAAWRRFNAAIAERRFPGREAADGLMIAIGGTLLVTPGFITDVVGLLLLLPPTRALIRRALFRYLRRRMVLVDAGTGGYGAMRDRPPSGDRPYDYEGTAREMPSSGAAEEEESAPNGPQRPRLPPS